MSLTRRPPMSPTLLSVACAVIGMATALLTGSFGLLAAIVALSLAVPLVLRGNSLAALSGLLIGFGGTWLALLAWQGASGGVLSDTRSWVLIGAAPFAIGVVAAATRVARSLRPANDVRAR